jgi:hypothetical protein
VNVTVDVVVPVEVVTGVAVDVVEAAVVVVESITLVEFDAVSVPNTVVNVFDGSAAICAWPDAPVETKPLIS